MARKISLHEDLSREGEIKVGSDRSLGLVFAAVFVIVGLFPLWGGGAVRIWALGVAGVFAALALVAPRLLRPLNQAWFRFGQLLHKIVSPLIIGLLFFTTVTPTGLLMRLSGKDPLRLRFDPTAESYWIPREPPGPDPKTMRQQF
jgi:hypothetical protein